MNDRMMVVAAHMGDFVWRCGGTIAKYIAEGNSVKLIVLSDGIRGEANDYWKCSNANLADGKKQRREEGQRAGEILGITEMEFWDIEDYPLEIERDHIELLAHKFREFRSDFIVTHDTYDAYNPDHALTNTAVRKAFALSTGAGFQDGLSINQRNIPIFGFEPQYVEASSFIPGIYIDITESFDDKYKAMQTFESQKHMPEQYVRKAETRGKEARAFGRKGCKYAEAFSTFQAIATTGKFTW